MEYEAMMDSIEVHASPETLTKIELKPSEWLPVNLIAFKGELDSFYWDVLTRKVYRVPEVDLSRFEVKPMPGTGD